MDCNIVDFRDYIIKIENKNEEEECHRNYWM